MSGYAILQLCIVLVLLAVFCLAVSQRRVPYSLNYTLFVLANLVYSVGYLLEITAPTLEAAVVACKVQYLGIPLLGVFYYLFVRDFCGMPVRHKATIPLLLVVPVAAALLVYTWPAQHWFYAELTFTASAAGFNYLLVTPGPLYYVQMAYSYGLSLVVMLYIVRSYRRGIINPAMRNIKNLLVFVLASLVVLGTQLAKVIFPAPSGYDYMALAFTVNIVLLGGCLVRTRIQEWTVLGRDSVMENMRDAFILMDAAGNFIDANAQAMRFIPALRTARVGTPIGAVEGVPDTLVSSREPVSEFTVGTGEDEVHLRLTRTPLSIGDHIVGSCVLMYDVSEIYQLMDELRQLATLDSLTGIYNRGTFFTYAQRDMDLALRKSEPASLLMMDIDHFKLVNDEYGHQAGDEVLVSLAGILTARLRHTDIMGRYGGEEIAVWLPGANTQGAALIADVIRRALEHTTFESDSGRFHVTISIGVAGLDPSRHPSLEALIADADAALYLAKAGGRNRVVTFSPTGG